MACAAKSLVNCALMATNGGLTSAPAPFGSSKKPYSVSIPSKPIKIQLCCSYVSSLYVPSLHLLKKEGPVLRIAAIAAQQEENNPVLLEEQEYEGNFNWGESENEAGLEEGAEDAGESAEYADPPEEAKIYVGNLPFDVDSEQLAKLFEEAGVVEIAEVIYNRDTDRSRGFGFVTMSTIDEAEKAVEMFHRYDLNGRLLTVNKASPKGARLERPPRVSSSPSNRIYVGNLPWSITDDRLEQVFSEHGKVVSAQVLFDRETGRSRGFGFVVMSSESEMNEAIANLDGQSLDGRAIRVNVAEDRPRRGSF